MGAGRERDRVGVGLGLGQDVNERLLKMKYLALLCQFGMKLDRGKPH